MLMCGIDQVQPGMAVAASVFHPRKAGFELLRPGVVLDAPVLKRLRNLGVSRLWIDHDVTRDLDEQIVARPSDKLLQAYHQLRNDFSHMSRAAVSCGQLQTYRQLVMDMMCEVIANRNVSGLTERLIDGGANLFTHGANVAYLSLCVGLELEAYIVHQRARLEVEHARDLTALGIGALVHDIGKLALPEDARQIDEVHLHTGKDAPSAELLAIYQSHVKAGFDMFSATRAPASAKQIVLNHHQHWDGSGFPDMSTVSRGRRNGPQQREQIHVFSRIVLAASVLDHLMRSASAARKPLITALHAFVTGPWNAWFDPVVMHALLRKVPPFAVGEHVTLSDGRQAVVIAPNVHQPCRPTVRILPDADAETDATTTLDLAHDFTVSVAAASGTPVTDLLFDLPDHPLDTAPYGMSPAA